LRGSTRSLSVDNLLSKKLLFCRKTDYAMNGWRNEWKNIWYSQLGATSIQLQVFPPQHKMCVYIFGAQNLSRWKTFLSTKWTKKKGHPATRSSIWNNDTLPQLWKQFVTTLICKKVYERNYNNCRGIPLLPTTYKILSIFFPSTLTQCIAGIISHY
jgi:hypothetical protein